MVKTAFIFPGQGGQFLGQGKKWAEEFPEIMDLFNKTDEISKLPIKKLCFEGPLEELSKTINLQPAVLAVSLAALRIMKKTHKPDFAAGHSLGEFGALCAAEVLDEETAINLVSQRAVIMQQNAAKHQGSMLAALSISVDDLMQICELASADGYIEIANYNTPSQTVLSGESVAVAAAAKYIKLKGGKAIGLPVSGAFHSKLMKEAMEEFAQVLEEVTFKEPICPIIPNALGDPISSASEIKSYLKKQIASPVQWVKTIKSLEKEGVSQYIEAWPKTYVANMVKQILPKDGNFQLSFQS